MAAPKRKMTAAAGCSYLPDELWELIFKLLYADRHTFNSLSLVSKHFLSITNGFEYSLKVTDKTILLFSCLYQRYPNLTSLSLDLSSETDDFNALLVQISTFPNLSNIKSLYLSNPNTEFPAIGLEALSKNMTNLTSLTCSKIRYINGKVLFFITRRFPLLEELDLSYIGGRLCSLPFPKPRKMKLSGYYLFKDPEHPEHLQEVTVIDGVLTRRRRRIRRG